MCKTEKAFNLFSASSVGPVLSRLVPMEAVFEYPDGVVSANLNQGKSGKIMYFREYSQTCFKSASGRNDMQK